jgi:hypothetical protein
MTEIILTPDVMTAVDNAVEECVNSLIRVQAENEFRKDVVSALKEKCDLSTSQFNALVKERLEGAATKRIEKDDNIVSLNEALIQHRKNRVRVQPVDGDEEE